MVQGAKLDFPEHARSMQKAGQKHARGTPGGRPGARQGHATSTFRARQEGQARSAPWTRQVGD